MRNISRIIVLALLVVVVGTVIVLATGDIPAPVVKVEKAIPNDRFPK